MVEILNNPTVQRAIRAEQSKDGLRKVLAEALMSTKTWPNMISDERRVCVHHIVSQSETEEELHSRLTNELGLGHRSVSWMDVDQNNKVELEAQALLKALGGLLSKNGALVNIMTPDEIF